MASTPALIATALANDERVAKAKRLLIEAVADHQKNMTSIRPPIDHLKQSYQEMITTFGEYRGGKLWHQYLGSGFGHGPFVELADGSIKYDFISGIGPHYWGHSHHDLINSGIDAAISNTVMQGNLQQNVDSYELTASLVKLSGMAHGFLTSSGAMANENAFKIAFQKHHPATRVLAFDKCFAGRTLMLSQVTDKPAFREGLPMTALVDYIPFFDPEHPQESTQQAVDTLHKLLKRYPKQHALMCFELIQGEGGFYSGTKAFYEAVMTILKENHIAIFADEVQSFARSPQLFAFQYFGLERFVDIVSIGKVSQVCATLFTKDYLPKPGLLSQTFTGSTSAIKACQVILKGLLEGNYFGPNGKISTLHNDFVKILEAIAKRNPKLIHGPYGLGCMIAFTPYDGEEKRVVNFVHRLFDNGIVSFVAGSHPMRVRFLIPVGALTPHHIEEAGNIIEATLLEAN